MFYWGFGFIQIREFYLCHPFLLAFAIIFDLTLVKVGIYNSVFQFLIAFLTVVRASSLFTFCLMVLITSIVDQIQGGLYDPLLQSLSINVPL